jgi:hypothetical protein
LEGEAKEAAAWLNENVGFDDAHDLIVNLGEDEMVGTCVILPEENQSEDTNNKMADLDEAGVIEDINHFHIISEYANFNPESQIGGIVVHSACLETLRKSGLDIKSCRAQNNYQGQEYNWELALREDSVHHISPLENAENERKLIEKCT